MFRKIITVLLCAGTIFCLVSCGNTKPPTAPQGEGDGLILTVIAEMGDTLYLAGEKEYDIYTLPKDTYKIIRNGAESENPLTAGEIIETDGNYAVEESLPAHLYSDTITVLGEKPSIPALMTQVFDDLMEVDSGLNGGITAMYYEPIPEPYLTAGEQATFVYVYTAKNGCGMNYDIGTFDELSERGHINKEELYCEDGIFMRFLIKEMSGDGDKIKFDAEKWRSGLGAYYFMDCKAEYKNGQWSYKIGSEAIS